MYPTARVEELLWIVIRLYVIVYHMTSVEQIWLVSSTRMGIGIVLNVTSMAERKGNFL
jgi:hypothetical protein